MEIVPSRVLDMATSADYCRGIPRGSGPLQSPSLLSLRRFAANQEASDRFRAPALGKNTLYIASIRSSGGRVGTSAGRQQRKCRGQLLVGAHLPSAGG